MQQLFKKQDIKIIILPKLLFFILKERVQKKLVSLTYAYFIKQ